MEGTEEKVSRWKENWYIWTTTIITKAKESGARECGGDDIIWAQAGRKGRYGRVAFCIW